MASTRKSLWQFYPWRYDVVVYIFALIGLLIKAQLTPVIQLKKFIFWKSDYSIWSGTVGLFQDHYYDLAAILFIFSIIFPFAKLATLLVIWMWKFSDKDRQRVFRWLEILGHWSMLDVFVVALLVVIAKTGTVLETKPEAGIYLFAVAVLLSMVLTTYIRYLARRVSRSTKSS